MQKTETFRPKDRRRAGDSVKDDFIAFLERYQDAKRSVMIRQMPFKANLTKREDWFGEPYT